MRAWCRWISGTRTLARRRDVVPDVELDAVERRLADRLVEDRRRGLQVRVIPGHQLVFRREVADALRHGPRRRQLHRQRLAPTAFAAVNA